MDFDLSDEQRLLADSVTRLLADQYGFEARKAYQKQAQGWSTDLWSRFAELGLLGLPFAEDYGGFGGGPVETMLVMEQFGRALVLEPYVATVVLAGTAIREAGTAEQKQALLPQIAEGTLKLAFAHGERQARYDLTDVMTTATRNGKGWVLDGAKSGVTHGDCADRLVISARTAGERDASAGITLFLVDAHAPGVARRGYAMRDEQRAADIALSNVHVADADVLGDVGDGLKVIERVVETGIAATAAEAVGAMAAMNDLTLEYSRTREQFGKPIGSYPAERARSMAMAKVGVGQACRYVSQSAVQMHGGIGMTEEYAVGHYFRRCMVIERLFGDPAYYLAKLAAAVE
jgi:alkylation response protein AidB-like acyl-CoA dehydrogenase